MQHLFRIGFLTPEYPTEAYTGGIGSYVRQMAYSLYRLGHSTCVLLPVRSGEGLSWDGPIPIHKLAVTGLVSHLPQPLGKRSGLVFARRLVRLAEKLGLDLLEAPDFAGMTAFLSLVKPARLHVVVRLHCCTAICRSLANDVSASKSNSIRVQLQDYLEKRAIQTADLVTAISTATVDQTKRMLRLSREDFRVTPNPVNDGLFSLTSKTDADKPLVLFVGRLQWLKGPDLLIRCLPTLLQHHPNLRLCLVGKDTNTAPGGVSMLAYLKSLFPERISSHVEFTGFLEPEKVLKKYQTATACVFPSRWEGFGLVAAEAMACGKPTIVTDAGGFMDLISDNKTGLVVKSEDPNSLAFAIDRLLSDSQLCARLGAAARAEAASRFCGNVVAQSTAEVYRSAIAHV